MSEIEIGTIINIFDESIYPAKNIYCACVCVSKNFFLKLNSENRAMYDCIPISKKQRQFYGFISCSNVFEYSEEELKKSTIKGNLHFEDIKRIKEKVETSKTIVKMKKEQILCELEYCLEEYL